MRSDHDSTTARVGRNDPCLAQLRRHAPTFEMALALVRAHHGQAGRIRIHSPHGSYGWECLTRWCGNVEYTASNRPPGICTACLEQHGWSAILPDLPGGADPDVEWIPAAMFEPGFWFWISRAWGRMAPYLVLCDALPPRILRVRCGPCSSCPEALRRAAQERARIEYEWEGACIKPSRALYYDHRAMSAPAEKPP